MENVCRTCLDNRVTLVNIFSEVRDPTLDKPEKNLSFILSECTNRPVSRNDGQPQFICLSCVKDAQNSFRFKQQCDRSYKRFCQLQNKSHPREWLLEEDQDQDENDQEAITLETEQKEASKTKASRSISCTPKSSRYGGPITRERQLTQSPYGTERKQIQSPYPEGKLYECSHCDRSYKTKSSLKRHSNIHVTKPKHKCPFCSKAFWRSDIFIIHLRIHDKDGPHACKQCSSVFTEAIQLVKHRLMHKEKPVDRISRENSFSPKSSPTSSSFLEPHVGYTYDLSSKSLIRDEIQNHHIGDTNPANKSTTSLRNWKPQGQGLDLSLKTSKIDDSSSESSEDHPKYNCHYCSQAFSRKYWLTRHLRTHEEEGPLSCSQCTAVFIDVIQLERHQREHKKGAVGTKLPVADNLDSEDNDDDSEDKDIDASPKNPSLQDPVRRHFCDLCPQAFVREDNLRFHKILKHHSGDKNPAENSTKLLREWETQSSTIDESSDDHSTSRQTESGFDQDTSSGHGEKQIKLQRIKCPQCSRTYKHKRNLQRHLVIHNTTPKHKCPHCPKAFWRRDHFQVHLRIHGSGSEYSCNQCSANFNQSCSLTRHYRNAHEKRNVIKCSYCSKKYQSMDSLKRHERVHNVHKTEIGARNELSYQQMEKPRVTAKRLKDLNIRSQ